MAATLDLITLDEAKLAINVPLADTTSDAEIASYVTAVSQRIDDMAGPVVKRTITAETHDGGSAYIFPTWTPVLSVTSVSVYLSGVETALTAETNGVATTNNYLLTGAGTHGAVIRRRSSWSDATFTEGRGNVVITYVAGRYDATASVAPKFKQAAAIFLAHLWRYEQGQGSVTFGSFEEGLGIPTFGTPNAVRDMLSSELLPKVIA